MIDILKWKFKIKLSIENLWLNDRNNMHAYAYAYAYNNMQLTLMLGAIAFFLESLRIYEVTKIEISDIS